MFGFKNTWHRLPKPSMQSRPMRYAKRLTLLAKRLTASIHFHRSSAHLGKTDSATQQLCFAKELARVEQQRREYFENGNTNYWE